MKKIVIIIAFAICLISPEMAVGQSAKEAILALKKMEARIQAGISYKDYSPALGDTKFAINLFKDSDEATANPTFTKSILKTMEYYEDVWKVWSLKFGTFGGRKIEFIDSEGELGKLLINKYPNAGKPEGEGGVYLDYYSGKTPMISIDAMTKFLSNEASKEIKHATVLLKEGEENKKSKAIEDDIAYLKKENERLMSEIVRLKKENKLLREKMKK